MTDHKQAAIKVGAEKLYPGLFSLSDNRYSIEFDNPVSYRETHQWEAIKEVGEVMDAMLPHLREMIAEEIRGDVKDFEPSCQEDIFWHDAHMNAARIAKGPQQ